MAPQKQKSRTSYAFRRNGGRASSPVEATVRVADARLSFLLPHERDARARIDPVLSGGPLQVSSAQQMHVQVEYGLSGARAHIQHGAIPIFDAALPG